MSASTTPMTPSTSVYTTPVFWERLWRGSGVQFVVFGFISPIIGLLWVLVVSRVLLARSPATRAGW